MAPKSNSSEPPELYGRIATLPKVTMDCGDMVVKITGRLSLIFSPGILHLSLRTKGEVDLSGFEPCDLDRVPGCRYLTVPPNSASVAAFSTRSVVTVRLLAVSNREKSTYLAKTFFRTAAGSVSQAVHNTSLGAFSRMPTR
jgi:hypothetical protein